MNDHQVHWIEGGGYPGVPAGASRNSCGTRIEAVLKVRALRTLHDRGLVHSISVFLVGGGARLNVTSDFVTFDSRTPRRVPDATAVTVLGKRIDRAAYK